MHVIKTAPHFAFVPHGMAVDTLFSPIDGRTATGTYKRNAGGVVFYTLDDKPFAYLVTRHRAQWFVSCGVNADGHLIYMQGLSDHDAALLGLHGLTYSEEMRTAERIASALCPVVAAPHSAL